MRRLALLPLVLCLAGCGGGPDRLTIYLPQRLGPDGPHGQRSPVLMPVERARRETMSTVRQAVLELMVGPPPPRAGPGLLGCAAARDPRGPRAH